MEILQNLLDGTQSPVLMAFILGLMTAISPCPLATNITAIGFISKDLKNNKVVFFNGLWYTLGRTLSYTGLGIVLFFGANTFHVARFFQSHSEKILGPILIVIGIFMLDIINFKFPGLGNFSEYFRKSGKRNGALGAVLMGMAFALAFCPYSGVLYFLVLIPLSIATPSGLLLPPVFALATGLPVIIFAYLIAFTISGVGKLYNRLKLFELWFRRIIAIVFILAGLYYIYIFYLQKLF